MATSTTSSPFLPGASDGSTRTTSPTPSSQFDNQPTKGKQNVPQIHLSSVMRFGVELELVLKPRNGPEELTGFLKTLFQAYLEMQTEQRKGHNPRGPGLESIPLSTDIEKKTVVKIGNNEIDISQWDFLTAEINRIEDEIISTGMKPTPEELSEDIVNRSPETVSALLNTNSTTTTSTSTSAESTSLRDPGNTGYDQRAVRISCTKMPVCRVVRDYSLEHEKAPGKLSADGKQLYTKSKN